jgi:hypothetical protein
VFELFIPVLALALAVVIGYKCVYIAIPIATVLHACEDPYICITIHTILIKNETIQVTSLDVNCVCMCYAVNMTWNAETNLLIVV